MSRALVPVAILVRVSTLKQETNVRFANCRRMQTASGMR